MWVLKDRIRGSGEAPRTITVRPVGVHQVGAATVAHLTWSMQVGSDAPSDHALQMTHAELLNQVAVTDAGLYMFPDSADDADIAKALTGKPARSDPPKAYKATKLNEGRYQTIDGDVVCMGWGPAPGDPECDDTCDGRVCISASAGVVALSGNWAPDDSDFSADAYQ
jgi:hypothetical protein